MREGLETSPAPKDGRSARPADIGAGEPGSIAGPDSDVGLSAPTPSTSGLPWKTLGLWFFLAATAVSIKVRYTTGSGAGALSANDAGPGGAEGAIDTALGVLGCVMILVGALVHRLAGTRGVGLRRPLAANVFLCALGGICVGLASGLPLGTPQAGLMVSLGALAASLVAGSYLTGWLPETPEGQVLGTADLTGTRQALLQRLWTLTDVPPERLESLLGVDFPGGSGTVEALRRSLRARLRPVRRSRRERAAVDILQVPPAAVPEALRVVSEHGRLFALERLHSPMTALQRSWQGLHLAIAVVAALAVASGLLGGGLP